MSTTADDLWDTICKTAERRQATARQRKTPGAKPPADVDPRAIERALLDALCGGMTQWTDDAQVFIVHHWQCKVCGSEGIFPNLGPRMVRRHNRAGTSWTCHDQHPTSPSLPVEFQHHHHATSWCHHCIQETNDAQLQFQFHLQPVHITRPQPGPAMRLPSHV